VEFAPRPLTFHCREIPSWLKGQQGYSQVDELEGERGWGERNQERQMEQARRLSWSGRESGESVAADASFTVSGASCVGRLDRARGRNR